VLAGGSAAAALPARGEPGRTFLAAAHILPAQSKLDGGDTGTSNINLAVLNAAYIPDAHTPNREFAAHKHHVLERTLRNDRSPKGSVDSRVVGILREINRRPEFVTTSSCSGRVFFMAYGRPRGTAGGEHLVLPGARTRLGRWRRVSHEAIEDAAAYFDLESEPLAGVRDQLWLKVQPFSLDVACASAADAQRLVAVAREVYQRGASTISCGREWRTVVSVEGHERLEMPFTICGKQVYSGPLEALASLVNAKLARNWARMQGLQERLRALL